MILRVILCLLLAVMVSGCTDIFASSPLHVNVSKKSTDSTSLTPKYIITDLENGMVYCVYERDINERLLEGYSYTVYIVTGTNRIVGIKVT